MNHATARKTAFFAIFCLVNLSASAQLVVEWQQSYGGSGFEQPFTTEKTRDGGLISGGYSESIDGDITGNLGNYDWWILKTDKFGNKEWARNYGGTNYDKCRAIMQNDDGTYMAFGSSHSSNGDLASNQGAADFWLLKLDSLGNILNNIIYGGSAEEGGRGVIRTADRGWMLAGWTGSNDGDITGNHGSKDAWLCKLDSNLNTQWNRCYGGTAEDRARHVVQLPDGGYVFGGNAMSNDGDLTTNNGDEDFWIAKVDSIGNLIWSTSQGTSGQDRIYNVAADWDGGFLGIGRNAVNDSDVTDNHGKEDLWIIKVDSVGSIVWKKSLGGSEDDGGFKIESLPDHGYMVTGTTRSSDGDSPGTYGVSDFWFIRLDSLLNFVLNDHIGGKRSDHCNEIHINDDGSFFMSGFSLSEDTVPLPFNNHGMADFFLAKVYYCLPTDISLTIGDTTICAGTALNISTNNTFTSYNWNTGDTSATITINMAGEYFLEMRDGLCPYKSDSVTISTFALPATPIINQVNNDLISSGTGNFQWFLNGNAIQGATGNILSNNTQTGNYTVAISDSNGCSSLSAPYQLIVGLNHLSQGSILEIAPNPFIDLITVSLSLQKSASVELLIQNVLGQTISHQRLGMQYGKQQITLPVDQLLPGTYLLTCIIDGDRQPGSIIIKQ